MTHEHKFVPVDVAWTSYWGRIQKGKAPKPSHVILACTCGTVKFVKAKLARGSQDAFEKI